MNGDGEVSVRCVGYARGCVLYVCVCNVSRLVLYCSSLMFIIALFVRCAV